ncbi:MAG: hypothetical protein NT013_24085 [Planctomycetia bacterium]|nr:hypothetical protein [Planctomycetia bacterium]
MFNLLHWVSTTLRRRLADGRWVGQVSRRRGMARQVLERLEERIVPVTFTVTSLDDVVAHDNFLTLRELVTVVNDRNVSSLADSEKAILSFNSNAQFPIPESETITINFKPSLTSGGPKTLTLGDLDLNKLVRIEGPGVDRLTISGNQQSRVFHVPSGNTAFISGLTIADGNANRYVPATGGGILNEGTLTLENVTVTNCRADFGAGVGGGIANLGGSLNVTDSTIEKNLAFLGGGIANIGGTLAVNGSTFDFNATSAPAVAVFQTSGGGSIYNAGENAYANIFNSTFYQNQIAATQKGGGIFSAALLFVTNSTLTANQSKAVGDGAGIYLANAHQMVLVNTIVLDNKAPSVFGIGYDNLAGANVSEAYCNLVNRSPVGGTVGGLQNGSGGNRLLSDAEAGGVFLPGGLRNYGGLTETIALAPNSLAIDAGDNALASQASDFPLVADQRGGPAIRSFGERIDIGAFEAQSFNLTVNTTANVEDGDYSAGHLSLREAVRFANGGTAGDNIITLQPNTTYNFARQQADNFQFGHNALPAITSAVIIEGNGAILNRTDTGESTSDSHCAFSMSLVARADRRPAL